MITSSLKMSRLAEKSHHLPSCLSLTTYKIIPFRNDQKNIVKYTIPILAEEPCKMIRDSQSHSKKSEVDFLGGCFMWLSVEIRIRKGKTLQKALQERQDRNSKPWTNYSSQGHFPKCMCPGPCQCLFLKWGFLYISVSQIKHGKRQSGKLCCVILKKSLNPSRSQIPHY